MISPVYKSRTLFILFVWAILGFPLGAQEFYADYNRLGILEKMVVQMQHDNPAAVNYLPFSQYTWLSAGFNRRENSGLFLSSDGSAQSDFAGTATGLAKNEKGSAAGIAQYNTGVAENVKWSDVSDNYRIGPYQLVDSSMGNRQYEQYLISGAVTHSFKNGAIGFRGSYRALGSYRVSDPRVRTTVSDIELQMGSVWHPGDYLLGTALLFNSYSQDVSVRNFQDDRKDKFYFLYGFGLYQSQLSGSYDNISADYSGSGLGISAFVMPYGLQEGLVLNALIRYDKTNLNYKEIIPGFYENSHFSGFGGYHWNGSGGAHLLTLQCQIDQGKGTEQIYETIVVDEETVSTDARLLAKSPKYSRRFHWYGLDYMGVVKCPAGQWMGQARVGLSEESSDYKTTIYEQYIRKCFSGISMGFRKSWKRSSGDFLLSANYSHTSDDYLVGNSESVVSTGQLIPDHEYAAAHCLNNGMEIRYLHSVSEKQSIGVTFHYQWMRLNRDEVNQFGMKLSFIIE